MTRYERKIFDDLKSPHLKYWVPFVWFGNLASKARKEGRIRDSVDLQTLMNVSRKSKSTENYTTFLCVPMYTQAHTAAVRWYCIYITKKVLTEATI